MSDKAEPWFKFVKKYSLFGGVKIHPGTLTVGMLMMTAVVVAISVLYNSRQKDDKRRFSGWPLVGQSSHMIEMNKTMVTSVDAKLDFMHELMKSQTDKLQETIEFLKYRMEKMEEAVESQGEVISQLKSVIDDLKEEDRRPTQSEKVDTWEAGVADRRQWDAGVPDPRIWDRRDLD